MVGIVRDELKLAAPGIEIGFALDVSRGIGDHRGSFEMIREIIEKPTRAGRGGAAGCVCAVKEDVFAFWKS